MDELITNTSPSESISINNYNGFCQYRLPCGYCVKLNRDCPKQNYNYNVSYNGIEINRNEIKCGMEN